MAPDDYDWGTSNTAKRYKRMRDALAKQDRVILFSMCVWGTGGVYSWGNDTGANWRMSNDIFNNWESVLRIANINSFLLHHTNFWGHNDADMLEIGNGVLNEAETRSHFALWAAMKSPLLIGADLTKLRDTDLSVLKNKYLLAFNQDSVFGAPAMPYKWGLNPDWTFNETWPAQYWSGESRAGTLVLLFNPGDKPMSMEANSREIPSLTSGAYRVTDIWTGAQSNICSYSWRFTVQPHDTVALLFSTECNPVGNEY
jgi:alpha-galactosidase